DRAYRDPSDRHERAVRPRHRCGSGGAYAPGAAHLPRHFRGLTRRWPDTAAWGARRISANPVPFRLHRVAASALGRAVGLWILLLSLALLRRHHLPLARSPRALGRVRLDQPRPGRQRMAGRIHRGHCPRRHGDRPGPQDRAELVGSAGGREEKLLHLVEEELPRARVAQVEPVVVDQLLLVLEPLAPADIADFL